MKIGALLFKSRQERPAEVRLLVKEKMGSLREGVGYRDEPPLKILGDLNWPNLAFKISCKK